MAKRFAKYELVEDGQYTRIDYLGEAYKGHYSDNMYYFYSRAKARQALVKYFRDRARSWASSYKAVKKEVLKNE